MRLLLALALLAMPQLRSTPGGWQPASSDASQEARAAFLGLARTLQAQGGTAAALAAGALQVSPRSSLFAQPTRHGNVVLNPDLTVLAVDLVHNHTRHIYVPPPGTTV